MLQLDWRAISIETPETGGRIGLTFEVIIHQNATWQRSLDS